MSLKVEIIILAIVLSLCFFVRWKDIGTLPWGIEGDEFSWSVTSLLNKYNIPSSSKGIWTLHGDIAKTFPVSTKINQLSFAVFGIDLLSPRKMLVIISVVSLLFFYLFLRIFICSEIALTTLIIYSFSPYKLITSRIPLQHPYSDLFLYPALILLMVFPRRKNFHSFFYVLISGFFILLGLLTYNLAYLFPLTGILIIIYRVIQDKISIRKALLLVAFFLMPLVLTRTWINGLNSEFSNRAYALGNNAFDFKQKTFSITQLTANINRVKDILAVNMGYDMLIAYNTPIINRIVLVLFIVGLLMAIFNFRTYFPLLVLLFANSLPYHVIFGLNTPRMWFLTVSIINLFMGVALYRVYQILPSKNVTNKIISWMVIAVISSVVIYQDYGIYRREALHNSSYLISHREIFEIAKKHKSLLAKDISFILPNSDKSPWIINTVYAAVTFNYVSSDENKTHIVKNSNMNTMFIMGIDEYKKNVINDKSRYIIDNSIFQDFSDIAQEKRLCVQINERYQFFTDVSFVDCMTS